MHARLRNWCVSEKGDYGWVFDNREDSVAPLLETSALMGFDVTDFLDNPVTGGPVTMYLFQIVKRLLDGRRLVVWMDEFSKLLSDPSFEGFAKDGLKTWRKLEGVAAFATQSPSDVLASPIARTLVEQTPTKIFFPNDKATEEDYVRGFGLSVQEYLLLKEGLEPGSRMFLIKQGHHSVVCELNLARLRLRVQCDLGPHRQHRGDESCHRRGGSRPGALVARGFARRQRRARRARRI